MKGVAERTLELMNEYQSEMDRISWRSFQHFLVVKIDGLNAALDMAMSENQRLTKYIEEQTNA